METLEPNDRDSWPHYSSPDRANSSQESSRHEIGGESSGESSDMPNDIRSEQQFGQVVRMDPHQRGARPDMVDIVRTWAVIVVGGLLGILLIGGIFLISTGGIGANNEGLPTAPLVGRYPPDFALQTLDGKTLSLSDLKGKPVWINFWATWCPPCRAEMPEMKQKYANLRDQGLVIVGIDVGEDTAMVRQFVQQNGFDWTFALDESTDVSKQYQADGVPTHLFVGRDGVIKAIQMGAMPPGMMDHYLSLIMAR